MVLGKLDSYMQWIKQLNITPETIKTSKRNLSPMFFDISLRVFFVCVFFFFDMSPHVR